MAPLTLSKLDDEHQGLRADYLLQPSPLKPFDIPSYSLAQYEGEMGPSSTARDFGLARTSASVRFGHGKRRIWDVINPNNLRCKVPPPQAEGCDDDEVR